MPQYNLVSLNLRPGPLNSVQAYLRLLLGATLHLCFGLVTCVRAKGMASVRWAPFPDPRPKWMVFLVVLLWFNLVPWS
jgi:hypothetical protein